MKLYLRILNYLKPYSLHIVGAFICMLVVAGTNILLIPLVSKLSEAIGGKNFFLLNLVVIGAVLLYFIKGLFTYGQTYLMSYAGQRVVTNLRIQIFKHLQDLSLDFFAKWRSGEVISRIINDIGIMQGAIVSSVTEILPNLVTLIGVLSYLIYLNWRLTFLTLLIIPILAFTTTKFGEEMRKVSQAAQRKAADIASILHETLSGVRVVKSFAMEEHEVKRFAEHSEEGFWLSMKESQITATQTPLLSLIQIIAVVAVIWYGGFEVVSGRLAPGNLIAFFAGVALLSDPISVISRINTTVQKSLSAGERVFEVIDIEPTVKEIENPVKISAIEGSVEFRNVFFKYDPHDEAVLKNINVKVPPGEIIALVGPSGAGKTTFVNLIPRFYDPAEGEILIDGKKLKEIELYSLRTKMGIVPQETILFSGTIRDNIAYGKIDATDEEIMKVAMMANAHEFIMSFKDGYNTIVGERGIRLSGGERQRIAIARAFLRNPRILILDEATSSLDTESERLVQDAMERLMVGRTTFIIAHRLSTVQFADRILVIFEGRIVEEGTHKELLELNGLYKRLYEMQFRDEENIIHK